MSSVRVAAIPWEDADCSTTEPCPNPECEGGYIYRWRTGNWTTPAFADMGVQFSGPYRKPEPCPTCQGTGRVRYGSTDAK